MMSPSFSLMLKHGGKYGDAKESEAKHKCSRILKLKAKWPKIGIYPEK